MKNLKKMELSEKINSLLGLEPAIDFTRLKIKDVERLYEVVSKIPNLVQVGARATVERVMQGPLISAAREVLSMPAATILREAREKGGIMGVLESRAKMRRREPEVKVVEPDKTS